ncbi:MAG: trypsin-like peptidase domain-containing protein [Anaerolineae bacterium]|nr:trypsin-like peptidase domain-containing protein [Anaerolineae bacterium]MCB0247032.1 trypsin-like peptidase domain-containing protein [Anaerolineae bacterium]MCB9131890.1 trypsin-like peptidase domain-containing protein [Anaerolineales bacterium]MCO5246001.1 trypsin-like peptidase domain-containing protein [Anaerolineae bacterium]HRX03074.1 trypsin-like peptidase domain-containing protein [Anaerolineae bacterium]
MIVLFVLAGVLVGAAFATVFGDNLGTLHIQDARASTATATDISAPAVPAAAAKPSAQPTNAAALQTGDGDALVAAEEQVLGSIYDNVLPSVVHIQVAQGQGSGFVWDNQGHIVTNNHVVEGTSQVMVSFADGDRAIGTVLGTDPESDLAVVEVDVPAANLKPVTLGDSDKLSVGQLAVALGNPFGLDNTMTAGIISALGRNINSGNSQFSIPRVIQTDAPINPGNSGGPLLDRSGEVIGINTQIVSNSGSNSGIGFSVPINIAKRVVPALIKDGNFSYSWLGVAGQTVLPDLVDALNLPAETHGVLISSVADGGPAALAGLRGGTRITQVEGLSVPVGGDVVISINGTEISSMDDLMAYLTVKTSPGDTVTLDIIRNNGRQSQVNVTLQARP